MNINESILNLINSPDIEFVQLGVNLLLRKDGKLSKSHYKWLNKNLEYNVTRHGKATANYEKGFLFLWHKNVEKILYWGDPFKTLKIEL